MGNHNILIINPKGVRRLQFAEDVSRNECTEWLYEYGPAPIGWHYQIVNNNKKKRLHPDFILVQGFNAENQLVDQRKAKVKHNNGRWYSVRMAKRDARKQGAIWFTREKIWPGESDLAFKT